MTAHPAEIACAAAVAALARGPLPAQAEVDQPVVPHVYFSWDTEQATVRMALTPLSGGLVEVAAQITGAPRWVCLSLALGRSELAAGAALGLAWAAECDVALNAAVFLRSEGAQGRGDTFFGDVLGFGRARSGVALLGLGAGDAAVGEDRFHTLILPLPPQSFALRLTALRLFHRPAPAGRVLSAVTLASAAQ